MFRRIGVIVLVLGMCSIAPAFGANDPPNIIFFLSDDHRADVLGCAGHPIVKTPNIDSLAQRGVRYANAFVTTSICAASRATILTGLVERTHGYTFGTPPLSRAMCEISYPHILRDNGYRTGFIGKLGVRVEGGSTTIGTMFDSFVPLNKTPYIKTLPDGSSRHVTDLIGDRSIEFIRSNPEGAPFCLSVSFNAGHAEDGDLEEHFPYPPSEAGLYADIKMPRPQLDGGEYYESQPAFLKESLNRQRYFWRWDTPEKYDRNLRNYLRMLSGLDRNIGRVLAELDAAGLADNTVILFMGDNGYYMGERGFAGKWSHYDESLRVPLVIYDPRATSEPGVPDEIALNLDIAPTILDAAGLEPSVHNQGASLSPAADGQKSDRTEKARTSFFCEHLMNHAAIPRWQGLRTERFKYARYLDAQTDAEWLHDLQSDPKELVNLADQEGYQQILRELRQQCDRHAESYERATAAVLNGIPAAPE